MRRLLLIVSFVAALLFGTFATLAPQSMAASNDGSIKVQVIPGPSLGDRMLSRAKSSWPWYLIRASGIIAAITLVVLMLSGIGQVTGYTYRFLEPLTAWATHRALGITFGISALTHIVMLLFDHFVQFNIWDILVPWVSDYRPVTFLGMQLGSLYVALGVLAFYLSIAIIITSLLWVEKKPATWKLIHLLSYIVIVFVFIHALYLGTDLAQGWLRFVWIALGAVIAASVVHRLWRAKTI